MTPVPAASSSLLSGADEVGGLLVLLDLSPPKMKMVAAVARVLASLSPSFFSNFGGYRRGRQGEVGWLSGRDGG